jgi:hypothetical protein
MKPPLTVNTARNAVGGAPRPSWLPVLVNFALFQLAWFACVLSGAGGVPLIGVAVVALVAGYHLHRTRRPFAELALLAIAATIGALWDGQLAGHGWLLYPSGLFAPWIAPTWIIAMWVSFATTLNVSMRWLHGRYGLALAFGALGGPLAFFAGSRLGAVQFSDPLMAMLVLSAGWALITPVLVLVATRLDGYGTDTRQSVHPDTPEVAQHV